MKLAEKTASEEFPGKIPDKSVLIYDGECPVCIRAVEWIRTRSDADAFEFLSCHSEEIARRFPSMEKDACLRALHLVLPDGTLLVGERAIPEILRHFSGYRWTAAIFRLPGADRLSRAFYRWFARHRHRAAGFVFPAGKGRDRRVHRPPAGAGPIVKPIAPPDPSRKSHPAA